MKNATPSMAKYVFYYLLALFALILTSIGIGQILFQIINSSLPDTVNMGYQASFDQGILRFGLAAVIITSPIYYIMMYLINRDLTKKILSKEAGIRKWLTYLILLISSIVAIWFLILILLSFLDGELTFKFILKALTAILISTFIFLFYLYDITRNIEKHDKHIKIFSIIFIIFILTSVVAGCFFIDPPSKVRAIKEDTNRINDLQNISFAIESYVITNNKLPKNLEALEQRHRDNILTDPITNEPYEYSIIQADMYQLCANFSYSNKEEKNNSRYYYDTDWLHDEGQYCFEKKAKTVKDNALRIRPIPGSENE